MFIAGSLPQGECFLPRPIELLTQEFNPDFSGFFFLLNKVFGRFL